MFVLAGCIAGFVLVYRATVLTVPGRVLGDAALRGADLGTSPVAGKVADVLDVVTVTSMIAAVAVVAVIALMRMQRTVGLAAVGLLVMASVVSRVLKAYLLTRPDLGLVESTPATLNSMPSGHTTAAFSIGVALLLVVPSALRPAAAALGFALSCAVAIAAMSAGWHRAGDSLASLFLVTACTAAIGLIVLVVDRAAVDEPDVTPAAHRSRLRRWLGLAIGGLLILAVVLVAVLAAGSTLRDSAIGAPAAFVAAGLLLVGTAGACTLLVLRIVERITPAPVPGSVDAGLRTSAPQDPPLREADAGDPRGPDVADASGAG